MTLGFPSITKIAHRDAKRALREDVGHADLTAGLIDPTQWASAQVIARESAVVCGSPWVEAVFGQVDRRIATTWHVPEGQRCIAGQVVLKAHGPTQSLLTAERTALNFLQFLSAVATKTSDFVQIVQTVPASRTHIVDTRKTLPGLRLAQKYAVRVGGGINHRLGLYDAVLIKENHIAAAGGVTSALRRAATLTTATFIEIEVETLDQLHEALEAGATMVLLDNMTPVQWQEAVQINAGRAVLEVSGGVHLADVRAIAAIGIDRISVGALTKDVQSIDFSMRLAVDPP